MKIIRFFLLFSLLLINSSARDIVIRKAGTAPSVQLSEPIVKPITIGIVSSPKVIGKYTQSLYNVSLATLMSRRNQFEIKRYDMKDESIASLQEAMDHLRNDGVDAVLAPLTAPGAKNLITFSTTLPIYIPTVHKRDLENAPENFVFGGIDYVAQIEALLPYMSDSIAIFYDDSSVGTQLKSITEEVFLTDKSEKKKVSAYSVDTKGDNIVSHLSKPAKFNKSSVILHISVVKSAILTSQLTFNGIKTRNILSTQINIDPTLLSLTQYIDRKNMILANSLIEFPSHIYAANMLMNNDIANDWIHYSTSVGIDYLVSFVDHSPREYTMRIVHAQVIYPVELLRAKEFGFEPVTSK
jgi:hypothetical protein